MPGLNEDRTALFAKGLVKAEMGAPNPRPLWIDPVFIFKNAFNNEDLLATEMAVWVEVRLRCPADKRRA